MPDSMPGSMPDSTPKSSVVWHLFDMPGRMEGPFGALMDGIKAPKGP